MGDKVCREKTFYFKPADGPGFTYKGMVCEEKKAEKAEKKEPKEECWYEKKQTGDLVKQLGGTAAVPKSILVRKCKPIES